MKYKAAEVVIGNGGCGAMRIGLDFDGTLTADPVLFAGFVNFAKSRGHSVVLVTARLDTHENRATIDDFLASADFPEVTTFFTGLQSKIAYMKTAGMPVDVWIEDDPLTCALGH